MQTTCPVHSDIAFVSTESGSTLCVRVRIRFAGEVWCLKLTHRSPRGYGTIVKQAVEHWAIITNITYVISVKLSDGNHRINKGEKTDTCVVP
jgi:hypothetical protein